MRLEGEGDDRDESTEIAAKKIAMGRVKGDVVLKAEACVEAGATVPGYGRGDTSARD